MARQGALAVDEQATEISQALNSRSERALPRARCRAAEVGLLAIIRATASVRMAYYDLRAAEFQHLINKPVLRQPPLYLTKPRYCLGSAEIRTGNSFPETAALMLPANRSAP